MFTSVDIVILNKNTVVKVVFQYYGSQLTRYVPLIPFKQELPPNKTLVATNNMIKAFQNVIERNFENGDKFYIKYMGATYSVSCKIRTFMYYEYEQKKKKIEIVKTLQDNLEMRTRLFTTLAEQHKDIDENLRSMFHTIRHIHRCANAIINMFQTQFPKKLPHYEGTFNGLPKDVEKTKSNMARAVSQMATEYLQNSFEVTRVGTGPYLLHARFYSRPKNDFQLGNLKDNEQEAFKQQSKLYEELKFKICEPSSSASVVCREASTITAPDLIAPQTYMTFVNDNFYKELKSNVIENEYILSKAIKEYNEAFQHFRKVYQFSKDDGTTIHSVSRSVKTKFNVGYLNGVVMTYDATPVPVDSMGESYAVIENDVIKVKKNAPSYELFDAQYKIYVKQDDSYYSVYILTNQSTGQTTRKVSNFSYANIADMLDDKQNKYAILRDTTRTSSVFTHKYIERTTLFPVFKTQATVDLLTSESQHFTYTIYEDTVKLTPPLHSTLDRGRKHSATNDRDPNKRHLLNQIMQLKNTMYTSQKNQTAKCILKFGDGGMAGLNPNTLFGHRLKTLDTQPHELTHKPSVIPLYWEYKGVFLQSGDQVELQKNSENLLEFLHFSAHASANKHIDQVEYKGHVKGNDLPRDVAINFTVLDADNRQAVLKATDPGKRAIIMVENAFVYKMREQFMNRDVDELMVKGIPGSSTGVPKETWKTRLGRTENNKKNVYAISSSASTIELNFPLKEVYGETISKQSGKVVITTGDKDTITLFDESGDYNHSLTYDSQELINWIKQDIVENVDHANVETPDFLFDEKEIPTKFKRFLQTGVANRGAREQEIEFLSSLTDVSKYISHIRYKDYMTYIVFEHKDPETGETKDLTVFADGTTSSDVSDPEHLLQNFKDEIMNAFMAKHLGKGKRI